MEQQREQINYVEYAAEQLEETKRFFEQLLDWHFTEWGTDYIDTHPQPISLGFYRAPLASKSEQGAALLAFYSPTLERSQERVIEAGGTITKPTFSFPGGRRFHFCEPSGNEFAIWSDVDVSGTSLSD